ncbi:MAG TPA: hypothetical protein VGL70_18645 [Candidatus Binatia bacterium]
MSRVATFVITVSACLWVFSSIAVAQEYEIRLSGQAKTGEKYKLSTTVSYAEKSTLFSDGSPVKDKKEEFTLELVSSVIVLETSERGKLRKSAIVIEKCVMTTGGRIESLITPGLVVMAAREGKQTVYKIKDAPVDARTAKALRMSISFYAGEYSDDDIFGTREKKGVGDTWPVNAAMFADAMNEVFAVSIKHEDISGTMNLEQVVKDRLHDYFLIKGWLDIAKFAVPLPQAFRLDEGQLKVAFSGKYPIDHVRGLWEASQIANMSFTAIRPSDSKLAQMKLEGAVAVSRISHIERLE